MAKISEIKDISGIFTNTGMDYTEQKHLQKMINEGRAVCVKFHFDTPAYAIYHTNNLGVHIAHAAKHELVPARTAVINFAKKIAQKLKVKYITAYISNKEYQKTAKRLGFEKMEEGIYGLKT